MPGPHPLGHPDPASPGATALDTGPPSAAPDPGGNGGAARSGRGAGGSGEGDQARPVRPPGPSTKPALVVLGVVLLVFVLGVALELAGGSESQPTAVPRSVPTAAGAVLRAEPARPLLAAIVVAGQPPDDLLDALAVPAGSAAVAGSALDQGVETYDRSLRLTVAASQQDVISFFGAELPSLRWKVLDHGPSGSSGDYRILAQRPASDGLEWELGVTVSPTVFPPVAPGAAGGGSTATTSGAGSGTTAYVVRLFSQSDDD